MRNTADALEKMTAGDESAGNTFDFIHDDDGKTKPWTFVVEVYGLSDKVLTMALSCILLGAPKKMSLWIEVGGSMIAIDTLVHNFLHRTGILHRFDANHTYGLACYRSGGCGDFIQAVAEQIDARQFNLRFPKTFPRFVQHAIWRYCSQSGLDVCNGNRIDDTRRCENKDCRVRLMCDRVALL
jgi:hypothetical protein